MLYTVRHSPLCRIGQVHHMVNLRPSSPHTHLAKWRKHRGLSQEKLGEELQTPSYTIGRWERGETPISEKDLARVAAVLGATPRQLLFPVEQADLIARLDQVDQATHKIVLEIDDKDFKTLLDIIAIFERRRPG